MDAFHAGIRSPQEAEQLVAAAKRANLNTLIVQVRRRGDALYLQSFEPPLEDPAYDPNFDALAHILDVAHREGLEVHAWVNAMPVWRPDVPGPPRDPRHVFNRHGSSQSGEENWLTLSPTGEDRFPVGYFLDPGHPAAAAHVAEVYLNLVRNYKVDGIHFDYIRYPETAQQLPRGAAVGYNPTALARFRHATRRNDAPAPDDMQWMAWRRQQVTYVVRRISIEAKAINPRLKVSAAVVAWGKPPTSEKDFLAASPGQRVFQDWHSWLKEGLLDLALPMNYAREGDPVVRAWFDGWIRWEKKHKHGRQLAVGIGAYLNPPQSTLAQVRRARQPQGRHRAEGVSFFSYANLGSAPPPAVAPEQQPATLPAPEIPTDATERVAFLVSGSSADGGQPAEPAPFAQPARIPPMEWIERPMRGWLAGTVQDENGKFVDGATLRLRRARFFARTLRTQSDGNGFFGFASLEPGRYRVWVEAERAAGKKAEVEIVAGQVARVRLDKP